MLLGSLRETRLNIRFEAFLQMDRHPIVHCSFSPSFLEKSLLGSREARIWHRDDS
jgi:hypothetical protein